MTAATTQGFRTTPTAASTPQIGFNRDPSILSYVEKAVQTVTRESVQFLNLANDQQPTARMTTHTRHIFKFKLNPIQINSNYTNQHQPAVGLPRAPTMGATRQSHNRIARRMRLFTIFIILINLLHLLNVSPLHQPPPTMAPTTRAKKDKPIGRATNTTAATSVIRSTPQKARRNA